MTEKPTKGQQLAKGWFRAKSICKCGHSGDGQDSQHQDACLPPFGHGPCRVRRCGCRKFKWAYWMPAFEAALGYVQE